MTRDCQPQTHVAQDLPAPLRRTLAELAAHLEDEGRLLALCRTLDLGSQGDFPRVPHCYSRTLLYRAPQGTEVMVARWDAGAHSSIHGHPELTFVLVLAGRLLMEDFQLVEGRPRSLGTRPYRAGEHIWQRGRAGRFDNAIHRVTALEPSLSLHVYSDDALKGSRY